MRLQLLPLSLFLLCIGAVFAATWDTCSLDTEAPHCFQITCGFRTPALFPNNTACHTCMKDDIGSRFTQCDQQGMKSLIYFWKPPATCMAIGDILRLPESITNIPCNVECSSKQFLNSTTLTCEPCPAGHTSFQSHYIVESWKTLPQQMNTYCTASNPTKTCNSWRLRDSVIDSGLNNPFNNLNSTLSLSMEVSNNGGISFDYQFTSDNANARFYFLANGVEIAALERTSGQFSTFSINLPANFYDFEWQIRKGNEFSFQNTAILRKIDVGGLATASSACEPCPPGTYTNDQYQTCIPCPRNSYSNTTGATQCDACPPFTISQSGATECTADPRQICSEKDFYAYYGPCDSVTQKQTIQYNWIEPRVCNPNHQQSVVMPADGEQACDFNKKCKHGQINRNGNCVYCDKGFYATEDGTCQICANGYGTQNLYYVDRFTNDSSSSFFGFCNGECATRRGWRFAGDYADTGYSNGIATMSLIKQLSSFGNPQINIVYQLSCTQGNLIFAAAGSILQTIPCNGCDSTYYNTTLDLSQFTADQTARFPLSIVFQKLSADNGECNIAKVHNVTIMGTTLGGAANCDRCPAGTFADEFSNCDPCPAGSYSLAGSTNCTICNKNQYSLIASSSCTNCGNGMTAPAGSSNCTFAHGVATLKDKVQNIARTFNWQTTAQQIATNGYTYAAEPNARIYFNLEAKSNHSPCGSKIVCKQRGFFDIMSIGDDMDLRGIYTESTIGVQITSQSFRSNCNNNLLPSRTSITLLCDPNALVPNPIITNDYTGCGYSVTMFSKDVCPACVEDDWYLYKGDCIDYKRETYYVKKMEGFHMCNGGVQKNTTKVVTSCSPGVQVEAPYWLIAVVFGVALIIVVVTVVAIVLAVVLYFKNRRLNTRFSLLEEEKRNTLEMGSSFRVDNANNNEGLSL